MTIEMIEFGPWTLFGVVADGFANFFLGALWYMLLFNKPWIDATGRTPEEFEDGSPGPAFLLTLLGCFVTTGVLALVYGWAGGDTVVDGLAIGAILGAGVAAMEGMKAAVYNVDDRVKPWALYAVNGSYAVCGLMLAGAVYAMIV